MNLPTAPHRTIGSWPRIACGAALFFGLIAALAVYDAARGYRDGVAQTQRDLHSGAVAIAEQTARSVQSADMALRQIAQAWQADTLARMTADQRHDYLANLAVGLQQLNGFVLLDAAGRPLAASATALPAHTFVPPHGALFAALRAGSGSEPLIGRADGGMPLFPLVRSLHSASGAFAGAVVARVRVEYFQQFYRELNPIEGTSIALVLRDGTVLARDPPQPRAARLDASPGDDTPFAALIPVSGYPLQIVVTRDAKLALAPWRRQTTATLTSLLGLGLLATALMALLRRQFLRLEKTRRRLEISTERFELAVAGSDAGIWDWDIAGDRVVGSPRAFELLGLAPGPESRTRDEWRAAIQIHPDDAGTHRDTLRAHLQGHSAAYFDEFRVRDADAGWRWVRVRGHCLRDTAGRALRMAGSVADIDARKRAEDQLRLSQERFALAVAGSDDGVWDFDYAADEAFASPRARQIMGLPPSPEVQRPVREFIDKLPMHPDDAAAQHDAVRAHLDGHTPAFGGEWRFKQPGGGWRWVRVRGMCVRDTTGAPLRMAGSVSDIDSHKRAEQALRESEQRYELAVAGSDDGIWNFDFVRGEAFASQRARQIMGLPLQPEVQSLDEWHAKLPIHPDDAAQRRAAIDAHLSARTPAYEGEWRNVMPDGSVRWVRVRGVCVRDGGGRPLRMAGSLSDIDSRKRAEQALRESEQRYELAVAGSDDGVWDWDFVTGLAFESARARQMQGLPIQPEKQPLAELQASLQVHPDDAPRRAEALRAHLAGESEAYECEYRVLHDDGQYRWIRVRALCVRNDAGEPLRIAGSVSDIDAHKRAQESLRASEERFALAVAGSSDGILDWNIVDDSLYMSDRARRILGFDPDATIRTRTEMVDRLMPRLHPDDVAQHDRAIRAHLAGETPLYECDYRVRHGDGLYRWVRMRALCNRDATGRPIRMAGSVSDVDAAKQVEEALRRSEERYQLAVAGANEGLWDWDLATDRLFLSPRNQELLWLEPVEPQQTRRYWIDRTHYHPDDVPMIRAAISAHLRGETPHFRVEYRLRHHSGTWHWYRQRGVAIRDAAGRPTRMAGSMEDISDRKNAEAEREQLEAQLRQAQKLEAIGTLAGGIAHDFNNILAAILGYGELAQKDAAEGSPLRRHIDAALSAAMRAKSLVERILAFSRSGIGERVPVQVQSVVAEALDAVATTLPADIRIERRLAAGEAAVFGDPTQVHQVVMNLCANAVQSMKSSGILTVSLELIEQDAPLCTTCRLPGGRYVRLRVADTGQGIAADVLERIFDPFFTTKEIGVGTGLGLSLVHGIVSDLGGGIEVASCVGEGSTFTIYLPWQDAAVASAPAAEAALPGGKGQTILLVDDEEPLVRLGEEMIAELGYEPVGFTSSSDALASLRAEPQRFSAVLSDEAMPGMTGSELALQIHQLRPDLPIVLMSGYVTPALTERAQAAGVVEVLNKPLAAADILRSLAKALRHGAG